MRKQKIEFSLDKELSKDAVDKIFMLLKKHGAEDIELDFINLKEDGGSYE